MHRSKAQIIIFLAIVSLILGAVDLVSYWAIHEAFGYSWWTLWALFAMSACFVGTTIAGRYSYDLVSRPLYAISAAWLGVSAYVFMASILYAVLFAFLPSPARQIIGQTIIAIALLTGICGIVNARRIRVRSVSVALPNLPESWVGKKALWMSDLHLGQVYGKARAAKIVKIVNDLEPEFVCIGGDLYDGSSVPAILDHADPLRGIIAPKGTYFVMGNHEEFGDNDPFGKKIESLGIKILKNEMVALGGLQLIGVDYADTEGAQNFETTLDRITSSNGFDRTRPSILLKHEPRDLDIAEKAGISFQISGHVHRGQQWPFEYIAKRVYKGFAYGLKRLGGMQVYVSSGAGTWGPPLRVGTSSEVVALTFTRA